MKCYTPFEEEYGLSRDTGGDVTLRPLPLCWWTHADLVAVCAGPDATPALVNLTTPPPVKPKRQAPPKPKDDPQIERLF
jgi:hypothetical protein